MAKATVKIQIMAQDQISVVVTGKCTVEEALEKAGVEATGDIYVNGKKAGMKSKLKSGDVIGIVGEVTGG